MKKITSLLLVALLSFTLIFMASCNDETETPATSTTASSTTADNEDKIPAQGLWANATYRQDTALGQGEKSFSFVVEIEGQSINFTVNTNKATVGEALLELNLIEGEDSAYGLYVKKVNGVLADYDVDGTYWAFYVNGEYASSGVDTTNIVSGATYKMSRAK